MLQLRTDWLRRIGARGFDFPARNPYEMVRKRRLLVRKRCEITVKRRETVRNRCEITVKRREMVRKRRKMVRKRGKIAISLLKFSDFCAKRA